MTTCKVVAQMTRDEARAAIAEIEAGTGARWYWTFLELPDEVAVACPCRRANAQYLAALAAQAGLDLAVTWSPAFAGEMAADDDALA